MKVVDTFSKILDCYIDNFFNMGLWENYANQIFEGLSDKLKNDVADYDFQNDILPLLNNVAHNFNKLDVAHRSFLSLTDGLSEKIRDILQTDLNVSIIFYLGLCNGAGWATELDGDPVVLLGAEKIIELSWYNKADMAGLVYHELGHIWHDKTRSKMRTPFKNGDLWQFYREGVAMFVEQLLIENTSFYHQDKNGWLSWCQANQKELLRAFKHCIINGIHTRDFFGDWNNYQGKCDIGYYLGCEIIKELFTKYSLIELSNLEEVDIYNQLSIMAK